MTLPVLASLMVAVAGVPVPAGGGHDAEVRAAARCGHGGSAQLRVRRDDGALEVRFELEHSRTPGARWRLVLVHEGRVDWRGSARARGSRRGRDATRQLPHSPRAPRAPGPAPPPPG